MSGVPRPLLCCTLWSLKRKRKPKCSRNIVTLTEGLAKKIHSDFLFSFWEKDSMRRWPCVEDHTKNGGTVLNFLGFKFASACVPSGGTILIFWPQKKMISAWLSRAKSDPEILKVNFSFFVWEKLLV